MEEKKRPENKSKETKEREEVHNKIERKIEGAERTKK